MDKRIIESSLSAKVDRYSSIARRQSISQIEGISSLKKADVQRPVRINSDLAQG